MVDQETLNDNYLSFIFWKKNLISEVLRLVILLRAMGILSLFEPENEDRHHDLTKKATLQVSDRVFP